MNGTAIPDVDFDIGESYAGLLPISQNTSETRELYFWFFPSENTEASDEILIWLNGGVSIHNYMSHYNNSLCGLEENE